MSTNFHTNVGSADIAAFLQFQTCFRPLWDVYKFPFKCRISGYSCFPTVSDGFRPVSDLFGTSTNVGSADIAAFLQFQTCFRPLWDVHKFPYKCRIRGYSCFPTVSNGFRPVSDLYGMSTNFHTNVGSADIAAFLRFQTCFRPLWDVHKFPYKCKISGYSCFPTVSDGFRPVSHLFEMSTNFHTNVGSVDIAAFLQFQTVSDLFGTSTNFHTNVGSADIAAFLQFQTCFRPLWVVHKFPYKCRISGYSCFPTVSVGFRPVSDLFGMSTNFHTNVGSADIAAFLQFRRFQTCFRRFQTCFRPLWDVHKFPYKCRISGFRPVSDLFGMSTNFHTNVGSADIAAFLQFQTVSDLFQASLGCPQISIQM